MNSSFSLPALACTNKTQSHQNQPLDTTVCIDPLYMLHLHATVLLHRHPHCILQPGLGRQMQTLFRCCAAAQHGLLAVKVLDDLLKRRVARLDVEEPDGNKLDTEPAAVEDVVFPTEGVKGDRVDVLVEEYWTTEYGLVWKRAENIWQNGRNLRARSTQRNMTVRPLARILYGRISAV